MIIRTIKPFIPLSRQPLAISKSPRPLLAAQCLRTGPGFSTYSKGYPLWATQLGSSNLILEAVGLLVRILRYVLHASRDTAISSLLVIPSYLHESFLGRFPQVQTKTTLRLMPLGGSVTYGVGSLNGNGYREFLRDMLLANDYDLLLVGSRKSGSMPNGDNEGWRGYRLDQIENKARRSVQTLLPNVFTINAGSNDCIQDFQIDLFGERMSHMLEYLWQKSPLSTVVLSTLLVNADKEVNSRVWRINDQIQDLVESKAAEGKRIILADMHSSEGPQLGDLVDGTHPNDEGYRKMAVIWFNVIQQARKKGFFRE